MAVRSKVLSIYNMMEEKGFFASNPANPDSQASTGESLYQGPVEFPKMLYHPQGQERVVTAAEQISTPFGPAKVGEKRELISVVVNNAEEEAALREKGWHDRPYGALEASGAKTLPPKSKDDIIRELEAKLARAQAAPAGAGAGAVLELTPGPGGKK